MIRYGLTDSVSRANCRNTNPGGQAGAVDSPGSSAILDKQTNRSSDECSEEVCASGSERAKQNCNIRRSRTTDQHFSGEKEAWD